MKRVLYVASVLLLLAATLFGNYMLGYVFALACSETEPGDRGICNDDYWALALVILFLPSLIAVSGALAAAIRRRFFPAVVGFVGAVVAAPVVVVTAWAIGG